MNIFRVLTTSLKDLIDESVESDESIPLSSWWINFSEDANFSIFDKIIGNGDCCGSDWMSNLVLSQIVFPLFAIKILGKSDSEKCRTFDNLEFNSLLNSGIVLAFTNSNLSLTLESCKKNSCSKIAKRKNFVFPSFPSLSSSILSSLFF